MNAINPDKKHDYIERRARKLGKDPQYARFSMAQRRVLAVLQYEKVNGYGTEPRVLGVDARGRPVVERIDTAYGALRRWAVNRNGEPGDIKEPVEVWDNRDNRVLSLDRMAVADTLKLLAREDGEDADRMYTKMMRAWGGRVDRSFLTLKHLSESELRLLERVGAPVAGGVESPGFIAKYRNAELNEEVIVRTVERPEKVRRFRVLGEGRPKFKLVAMKRLHPSRTAGNNGHSAHNDSDPQEGTEMASKTKTRKRTTKPAPSKNGGDADVDDEELEELEAELEELDEEEPEDVDEDEDEEEEEEKPKKRSRSRSKTKSTTTKRRRRRAEPETEDEVDEDDEDDEEEEDEDERPARRRRSRTSGKSSSAKSSRSKKATGSAGRSTADITGGVGTAELAKAAGVDGRAVRVYLRNNDVPKDEEVGRYHWPSTKNKEFVKLAKAIKTASK